MRYQLQSKIYSNCDKYIIVGLADLNVNLGVMYRQKNNNETEFVDTLEGCVIKFRNMILVGDANIDLMKNNKILKNYEDFINRCN